MPILKIYDIFISHAWKYGDEYNRLVNLLDQANNFYYRNYSAPQNKPLQLSSNYAPKYEIKNALDNKIRPVNIVLIISGMYYNYREWMQYEIDKSVELSKPIIAIKPFGGVNTPREISDVATESVNWNTDSIISAIRKHSI